MKTKIPPPVLLLFFGAVMWFVAQSDFALPFSLQHTTIIAVALAASGIALDLIALQQFRSAQTTINPLKPENASALVSGGLYARSRNPMYVGILMVLTGWGLWLGSYSSFAVMPIFVVTITELQIKPEEAVLRSLFGQSYVDYCARVRRWI